MSAIAFNLMKRSLILLLVTGCTTSVATVLPKTASPTSTLIMSTVSPFPPNEISIVMSPERILIGKEVTAIKVGVLPQLLVVGEEDLWVPNAGSGTLSRIDPQTNQVVADIPIGKPDLDNDRVVPSGAAIGNGFVWAAKNDGNSVVQIDPKTNQVVAVIPIGVEPFALAVSDGALWITSRLTNRVLHVDTNTQQVLETITDVNDPTAIAVTDEAVWVVNHLDDAITRIDPATNEIIAYIPLGTRSPTSRSCGSCTTALTIGANSVWVSVGIGGVVRIDPQTNKVIARIPTEGTLGITSNIKGIWVTTWKDQTILRIDPETNQIAGTIPSSAALAYLASGEDVLWATTDFSDSNSRNKIIRFDLEP